MIYTVKRVYPIVLRIHIDLCLLRSIIATICSWLMTIIEVILHCLNCPVLFNSESKSKILNANAMQCNAALPLWCGHTSGNRNHPTTSSGSVRDDDVDACRAHSAASGELTAPADQKEATACPAFPSGLAWNESLPTGRQLHQSASAQADNTTTEWQQLPSLALHSFNLFTVVVIDRWQSNESVPSKFFLA